MASHCFCSNNKNNLLMTNKPFSFFFFFLFLLFAGASPAAVAGRDDGVDQLLGVLSSREDFVQMAGYGDEKLSTVLISGTLVCEPCTSSSNHGKHNTNPQSNNHGDPRPVSGALVSVSCLTQAKTGKSSNLVKAETDEFGDFLIDLPSHLHGIPGLENKCLVKVLRLPRNSRCHSSLANKKTVLKLSSVGNGIRTYTTGSLSLNPKVSKGCRNKMDSKLVKTY